MIKAIPNLRLFLILTFLSLLIFLMDNLRFLDFLNRGLSYFTNPISFGLYDTSRKISSQFEFIFKARFAAQKNKALTSQLQDLLSENAALRKRLAEVESLLSQETYLDPKIYNLLPARPIGLDRYLQIDKGEDDGVKVGQALVFKDNFIGKITAVTPKKAEAELLSDPNSKVLAFSIGRSGRARGVLLGQFGSDILFDKIVHEEQIQVGDLVYSEGTEGYLPRGLILGKVTQVLEEEKAVFKQAKVAPNFDLRDVEVVFVIAQ